ncbi:MAG: DinB family protein [Blastocatellia bacterium]
MDGARANAQDYRELVKDIEEMPRTIQGLLAGAEEGNLRARPSQKTWSVVEHICHLRDIEREGYKVRIAKMLNEDHPFLTDLDGDKLAEERGYINQDFKAALKDFIDTRAINLSAIRDLSPDQLSRSGEFENVGQLTLMELLIKMREHDSGHIKELGQLLGKASA